MFKSSKALLVDVLFLVWGILKWVRYLKSPWVSLRTFCIILRMIWGSPILRTPQYVTIYYDVYTGLINPGHFGEDFFSIFGVLK